MDLQNFIQHRGNRVAFYGRHSTGKQDMQMQKDAFERFCAKYGCKIVDYYEDPGVSARKVPMKGRTGLVELLKNANRYDFIVAYADNRLARDPVEHAQIRIALEGIPVVLCDTETLYNPEHGDLLSQVIRDGASKFEIDQTMERTKDTFISKVKRGERIGGNTPWGYSWRLTSQMRRDKPIRVYEPVPECIPAIRKVFRMYWRGHGFRAIAEELQWFQPSGEPYKERVKSIIINPFYAGYVSMYKVKAKSRLSVQDIRDWYLHRCNEIEPVVSYEEWLRCFELYQNKVKSDAAPRRYKTSFLLAGVLRCETCGGLMSGKNQMKRLGARQYGKRTYVCETCAYALDATTAEHVVLQHVYDHVMVKTDRDWEAMERALKIHLEEEMTKIEAIERKLQRKAEQGMHLLERSKRILRDIILEPDRDDVRLLEEYRAMVQVENENAELHEQTFRKYRELLENVHDEASRIREIRLDEIHETGRRRIILELVEGVTYSSSGYDIALRVALK